MSREDEAWLESMRPWAVGLLRTSTRIGDDAEDAVQETFVLAARHWHSFGAVPELADRTARRRWLSVVLFRAAGRLQHARARALDRPSELGLEEPSTVESHEGKVQARELFGQLQQSTTPERWRAWLMHEVDGVSIEEIARQEGRPFATIYDRLRRARADFDAALVRDAASERAHAGRRK
jgi:DNA-directed RNA polymerase specialized sigma24 family protein